MDLLRLGPGMEQPNQEQEQDYETSGSGLTYASFRGPLRKERKTSATWSYKPAGIT